MSRSGPRLGRGLSALIAPRQTLPESMAVDDASSVTSVGEIPVDQIRRNRHQPRKTLDAVGIEQLAQSIRSSGILQPVIVRRSGPDQFELVTGERRWRAAQVAGLERIPAIIRDVTDAESLELALTENLQREDLSTLDRADAYRQYIDTFNVSIEQLAHRLGESRANIANYLRILNLSEEIRSMVESGQLGMGQARAIAGIEDRQRQLAIARLAARRNLAVRQVEALAREDRIHEQPLPAADGHGRHLSELEQSLSRALGLRVNLMVGRKKNSGRVVIFYNNPDEFDRVAEALGAQRTVE